MVISIFKLPEEGKTWAEQKTGDICDCISLEYEKYFNGVGTFTAELPVSTRFRDKLEVNSVLMLDSGDALIVKNIKTTLDKITLTGYDLNGLLCDRITLTDAEDGYDLQKGASETIIKHFVTANLVSCELDPNRNLPRFGVAEDKGRGEPNDSAMPRLQNVQELVTEICGAAKLGWRVSVNGNAASGKPIFVFDVAEQVDRSVNQSERNRVIFSTQMHNVSTMTREVGVTAAKNALFLDIGGTVVQYPQSGDDSGRSVFVGYGRREEYCSLTTDSLEESEYSAEAEQNMADRMNETDSLTIEAGNPLDYGALYDVGTIVTVYDRGRSLQLDSVISAATVRRSGTEYSVKLTLGESKPKLLDQYQKKSGAVGKVVRNDGGKSVSPAGVLTEYKYLSDLSAQCNGITYTAEKDTETGLISKISDSAGHVLTPEIPAGITDVAMHNAAIFALAMARGLGKEASITLYDGSDGSARWRGISGFTAIKLAAQARSVVESALYTSGAPRVLRLQKVCGIKAGDEYSAMDGYTDAFIARSTEQVDLTGYSRLRIYAAAFSDLAQLTAKVYFDIGSKSAPVSNTPYDFTGWTEVTDITDHSVNYYQPGVEFGWFEVDLSGITGRQYINIGVSHGTESPGNTAFFDVQKMILEV